MSLWGWFFFFKDLFIIIDKYTVSVFRHQKRASDLITGSCEPLCGCWDLNSGLLEEQSVLLPRVISPAPKETFLKYFFVPLNIIVNGTIITL